MHAANLGLLYTARISTIVWQYTLQTSSYLVHAVVVLLLLRSAQRSADALASVGQSIHIPVRQCPPVRRKAIYSRLTANSNAVFLAKVWPADWTLAHSYMEVWGLGPIMPRNIFIWLAARLQPTIGFTFERALTVFTRSDIALQKVNRFG